jgi:hypothetical protein
MPEPSSTDIPAGLDPRVRSFYLHAMRLLDEAGVPYMVGGAYSLAHHAGIVRHTKDLDLFIRRAHFDPAVRALDSAGYHAELIFPHWLGKAFHGDAFVDLIFGSGNGLCPVDDEWFAHAIDGEALGRAARLCPAEEIIWTKSFVQERERFDGADIAHLLLARGPELDWPRLVRRYGPHVRVLLVHLVMFGFTYPAHRTNVPAWVMEQLLDHVRGELNENEETRLCRGTLLSRQQYLVDIAERGFEDARRVVAGGNMSDADIRHWTAAIDTAK